jgi:hypothetical protein
MRRPPTRRLALLVALSSLAACARPTPPAAAPVPAGPPPIASGLDVVRRMHEAHAAEAPSTVTFQQANTIYLRTGETKQQWRVQIVLPSRMRIEYLPLATRSGVIYSGSDVYVFNSGRRVGTQSQVNPTLLLGFGVFAQEPAETARLLDSLGVQRSVVRRDTLDGHQAWVIGAPAGDLRTAQVWVDADRWVTLRLIKSERAGTTTAVSDTRFGGYAEDAGLPLATSILVYRDGRLALRQELSDVRVNAPVPSAAFDPTKW